MRFGRMKLDFNENNDNIDILEAIRTKEGLSDDYDLETVYVNTPLVVNVEVKQCELSNPVNAVKSVLVDYEF